jgi:hypothetical protein
MNRQSLNLTRVEISGIRNINWAADGGPGLAFDVGAVTILSAPNGVAKSSIIEALMLGLTGVGRRRGVNLKEAAYVHSPRPNQAMRARVMLGFGDNGQLVWEEGQDCASTQRAAAELLSIKKLGSPEAVANLLRLTHLLPQGWGERFTDHEGSARWTLVERALELNGLREAVRAAQGRGQVANALSRRMEDAKRDYDDARAAHERWDARAKEWSEARRLGLAAGALPQEAAEAELAAVAEALGVPSGLTLGRARAVIDERRVALVNTLASASRLHAALQAAEEEIAVEATMLRDAASRQSAAAGDLVAARAAYLRAEGAVAAAALPELRQSLLQAERAERGCLLRRGGEAIEQRERIAREAQAKLTEFLPPDALDAEVARAAEEATTAQAERENARSRLLGLERAHSELVRILRELRPHIEHDKRDPRGCPVCDKPSETLLDDLDVKLRALGDEETDEARARLAAAEEAVRRATAHLGTAERSRQSATSTRSEAEAAQSALMAEVARSVAEFPEYAAIADPGARTAAMRLDAASLGAAGITPDVARATRLEALRKVVEAEEAIRAAEPFAVEGVDSPTADLARHRLETAEGANIEASGVAAAAEQRHRDAQGRRDALLAELTRLGLPELPGTPVAALPATIEAIRSARTSTLDGLTTRVEAVRRGTEAYAGLSALRTAEGALRKEAGTSDQATPEPIDERWLADRGDALRDREANAKLTVDNCKQRIDSVQKWVSSLSTELQNFEDECLKAMDPTVNRFLEALAPTMRWRLSLAKTRNSALTKLANENAPPVSPAELLSEGEHTAVALAYLLAFHTRQRWSRWPALVLDDPFQAADVVRVGALLDVLRNMCLELGTQLILTTHEPQLAEWAARKMRNAGIDTRHFELERTAAGLAAHLASGGPGS